MHCYHESLSQFNDLATCLYDPSLLLRRFEKGSICEPKLASMIHKLARTQIDIDTDWPLSKSFLMKRRNSSWVSRVVILVANVSVARTGVES